MGEPQPSPPHTNTLIVPELFCTFYLTYEWFVSHRVHADIDDYTRIQPSLCQQPTLIVKALEENGKLGFGWR